MLDGHTAEHAWEATTKLAERSSWTFYGAADLALVQRRRLPLASLDRASRDVAIAAGVEVPRVAAYPENLRAGSAPSAKAHGGRCLGWRW
jgi:hypothetical protein